VEELSNFTYTVRQQR